MWGMVIEENTEDRYEYVGLDVIAQIWENKCAE